MAVMFQVEVFWVQVPCSVVVGYQRFGGPSYLHLQVEVLGAVMPCGIDRIPTFQRSTASQPRRPRL